MSQYRFIVAEFVFQPLVYEHHVVLPTPQREYLEDVNLMLAGHPTLQNSSNQTAPNDVHLYLDGVDVTKAYIKTLQGVLNTINETVLYDQYRAAIEGWLKLARALGAAYGYDLARDEAARNQLLTVRPFSNLVDQLGNLSAGNAGYLHVFNFLHTLIDVPGVSLKDVIDEANKTGTKLNALKVNRLTISNGPCRLFTDSWTPPRSVGAVQLQAEMRYHDPLTDIAEGLKKRIEAVEKSLEEGLNDIFDRLSSDGPIARAVAEAQDSVTTTNSALTAVRGEIQSQNAQLEALKSLARDLRSAVDALR